MQELYNSLLHNATNVSERETPPNPAARITLSTSAAFLDKKPLKGQASFKAFAPGPMDFFSGFIPHTLAGRAWMPAASKAQTRDCFISAQLLALDFDNNDNGDLPVSVEALKQHPLIAQYAAFVYATPSSTYTRPKSRAVFILDEMIKTAEGYQAAAAALIDLATDLRPDIACKDASRLFYGSKGAEHHVNAYAVLPLAMLREHAQEMRNQDAITAARLKSTFDTAHKENQRYATQARHDAQRINNPHKYALTALENNSAVVAHTPEGGGRYGGRNKALFVQAWKTWCVYEACGVSPLDIERAFYAAGRAAGLPDNEIRVTLASAAKYPRVVLSAMQGRAIGPDDTPPNGPGAPRRQYSAWAQDSKELVYYDDPYGEGVPMLAAEMSTIVDTAQDQSLSLYPLQLPDQWMFAIEDTRTALAAGLLNAIYGLVRNRAIMPRFTTEELLEALASAGYAFDVKRIRTTMSVLVKAELIDKNAKSVDFSKSAHYKIDMLESTDSTCALFEKMKNASRVYQVLDTVALGQRIQARVFEALLDDAYPHAAEHIDSDRAELMSLDDMRSTLDSLAERKDLLTLSKEAVYAAVPKRLKAMPRHKRDDEARHENARRKAVFYSVIRVVPPLVTTNGLMALGLTQDAAAAAAGRLNRVSGQRDTHGVITAKWAVLLQCHKRRMKLLEDMRTTPFAESDLNEGKAQVDAMRRARHIAYDNMPLSGKQQASLLGVDNRASAVRLSKRLGLRREERSERRAFTVNRIGDAPLPIEAVQSAVKGIVKKGEFATHIFSYDSKGKLFDDVPFENIEDLRIGGSSFEVHVQMTSIIHVEDKPARAAAADTPKQAQDAATEGIEAVSKQARRVHRTTLYTKDWVLRNMLAPRGISMAETSKGEQFIALDTGEASQDLLSIIEASPDAAPLASNEAVS